jgi:transcriptional regulator with XRE-family HTH domain
MKRQKKPKTADFVKTIRKQLNLTQAELSAKLGVDRSTVTKYELGTVIPPGDVILRMQELVA